jgi:Domain of unknown function (DUF6265)
MMVGITRISVLLCALLICVLSISARADADEVNKVTLKDLSFITGKWQGKMGGSTIEEYWSFPSGDNMIGMFRMIKDGRASLYELCVIEQTAGGPVLRLKQFRAGLIPREEKEEEVTLALIGFVKDKATFEAMDKHLKLIFHRVSPEQLNISLDRVGKDGKRSTTDFKYTLTK